MSFPDDLARYLFVPGLIHCVQQKARAHASLLLLLLLFLLSPQRAQPARRYNYLPMVEHVQDLPRNTQGNARRSKHVPSL